MSIASDIAALLMDDPAVLEDLQSESLREQVIQQASERYGRDASAVLESLSKRMEQERITESQIAVNIPAALRTAEIDAVRSTTAKDSRTGSDHSKHKHRHSGPTIR